MSTAAGTWHIQRPESVAAKARRAPLPSLRGATRCQTSACVSATTVVMQPGAAQQRGGDQSADLPKVGDGRDPSAPQHPREAAGGPYMPSCRCPRAHPLFDQPLGLRRHRAAFLAGQGLEPATSRGGKTNGENRILLHGDANVCAVHPKRMHAIPVSVGRRLEPGRVIPGP